MLTLEKLKDIPKGSIFATGTENDSDNGVKMTNSGRMLRWVAVKGYGPEDWDIRIHFANRDAEFISRSGDKVTFERHIKKLVECDEKAFKSYRK